MAPNNREATSEHPVSGQGASMDDLDLDLSPIPYKPSGEGRPPYKIMWLRVVWIVFFHTTAVYALLFTVWKCRMATLAWTWVIMFVSSLGVTAGTHRLWAHRSYRAKLPLRIFLAMCQTMAFQTDIYTWVREHRLHHKCSETDADPHNASRGFFYSHIGWMMLKKHPDVGKYGKKIDYSDLFADPVVTTQRKYYGTLVLVFWLFIPVIVPCFFWGESIINAVLVATVLRYILQLNITWLVNSAAHIWGNHPYDKGIHPAENAFVSVLALGEGWHNYHHVFPYDYRTGEFGWRINPTSMFIDAMAWIGQVTDRKTASPEIIAARIQRTGDKSQ